MTTGWHFTEMTPRDKTREAMQGEFFATEAIRNPAEALIREAIQNSLDAAIKGKEGQETETVRIRVFLAKGAHAVPFKVFGEFFEGGWPHFRAPDNGLRNPPNQTDHCAYLVIEDFGTTGLTGDVAQWHDKPGESNSFFYFFRAEGRTGKGEDDRGRWGIGKYVFPRSSRANVFFGLTVRKGENHGLLMGQSILKSHACNGKRFTPDGGFGISRMDGLVLPTEDAELVRRFNRAFSLSRREESGLSIVVPWIDPEEITFEFLLEAVVRGYFYPILEGKLKIEIEEAGRTSTIERESLDSVLQMLDPDISMELKPLIDLARWGVSRRAQDMLILNPAPDRPIWSSDIVPALAVVQLQNQLKAGGRISVRVPLKIRPHGSPDRMSYFDLFMEDVNTEKDRTVFVREGIIISDVRARRARGVRSIVVADHKPLATLLGDSENPAHTEWQSKSSNFHGKYKYGKNYLDFVIHSVSALMGIVTAQQEGEDTTLLTEYFALPQTSSPEDSPVKRPTKHKGGQSTPPEPPTPEPRRNRYRLQRVPGGFRVSAGDPDAEIPHMMDVHIGYDVRRGNAIRRYDPADFDLSNSDFQIETFEGTVGIVSRNRNILRIKVLASDFQFTVTGFDTNRDLVVNVNVLEARDAETI